MCHSLWRRLLKPDFTDMWGVKKSWTIYFGVAAIAVGILVSAAILVYMKTRALSDEIRTAEERIYVAERKKQEFSSAERGLLEYQKEIAALNRVFVREDTFVSFVRALEDAARIAKVSFKAQNARVPLTDAEETSFTFRISGDFASIVRFFSLLDTTPYIGMVDQVFIRREDDKSKIIQVDATYLVFNYLK